MTSRSEPGFWSEKYKKGFMRRFKEVMESTKVRESMEATTSKD